MSKGSLTHPSYLTRQMLMFGKSTAGANTVQYSGAAGPGIVFPFDVRIRNAVANVSVTGTSASPGSALIFYCPGTSIQYVGAKLTNNIGTNVAVNGSSATAVTTNTTTTTLGFIAVGTNTAGSILQSGDMNFTLPANQVLIIKNGTDATAFVSSVAFEYYIEPVSATWTGSN